MKYPYIASDLDGTISLHKNFEILPETIQDIITYQTKSNHHFTIATGRNYQMVKHYIDDLQIKLPIVTVNGAAVVDVVNEKAIAYTEFPKAAMLELVNYMELISRFIHRWQSLVKKVTNVFKHITLFQKIDQWMNNPNYLNLMICKI
jgi:HAD superfamily hydrolase (TIGR01484 family)